MCFFALHKKVPSSLWGSQGVSALSALPTAEGWGSLMNFGQALLAEASHVLTERLVGRKGKHQNEVYKAHVFCGWDGLIGGFLQLSSWFLVFVLWFADVCGVCFFCGSTLV